jgi:hypothetical protein
MAFWRFNRTGRLLEKIVDLQEATTNVLKTSVPFAQSSAAMCEATVASFQDEFPPCNFIPFNDFEVMDAFFEEHDMTAMKGLMLQLLNSNVTGANNYLKLLMTEELIAATTWTEPKKDKQGQARAWTQVQVFLPGVSLPG